MAHLLPLVWWLVSVEELVGLLAGAAEEEDAAEALSLDEDEAGEGVPVLVLAETIVVSWT